ncbi:hypothetical protein JCM17845_02330 [Iodidimonas gelatinilytica]|uniref:Uncharacterized protein n=1 Tax=Iodidimonas gelatinilytica TaxID=1236966 RepID=A0A5A7MXF1_9PROT|nr:hypothetical protein JCM17845_02330 [Iodidimonas gelatinilytica]
MHPVRGLECGLNKQRGKSDNETDDQNNEHGGSVTTVHLFIIKAALVARRIDGQKTFVQ